MLRSDRKTGYHKRTFCILIDSRVHFAVSIDHHPGVAQHITGYVSLRSYALIVRHTFFKGWAEVLDGILALIQFLKEMASFSGLPYLYKEGTLIKRQRAQHHKTNSKLKFQERYFQLKGDSLDYYDPKKKVIV